MAITHADSLINYLVDRKSFALGYPLQALTLVQKTDYVLTSCLGNTLKLIAIIDTDRNPNKRALFSMQALKTLKSTLKQFSYDAYSKRQSVSIEVWYVGNHAPSILKEPSVQAMKVTSHQFWLSAWAINLEKNKVLCNSFSLRNILKQRTLTKVLKQQSDLNKALFSAAL
ncbi:MAG: hypothetical protein AB7V32_09820 [Candidatus Berkiella sp.]